jgi:ferrochelatase
MKTAVILFNLGGPDGPEAVRPFLFNLFNDAAIIRLPTPLRWLVAKLISTRRAPIAREIYNNIGGRSPILPNTETQASALEAALGPSFKTFIAMRYWHPRAVDCVAKVKAWQPDRIILLPLYPQYSTTTTASSAKEWGEAARRAGLQVPSSLICCYPRESGFAEAVAARVRAGLAQLPAGLGSPRILFSAHGLPESIVLAGDPYQYQVTESVAAVRDALNLPDLDCQICYQSRVGPVKWLGPSTDDEIRRAGRDQVPVVVVPIAFVSEHSETLVELDIEYRHLADEAKVPCYIRVPTVDALPSFIEGLAKMIRSTAIGAAPICSSVPDRLCPAAFGQCAFQTGIS